MRIEANDYHAVAASAPELVAAVGALAKSRLDGLQEIAAEPDPPRAFVIGHRYDAGCTSLRLDIHSCLARLEDSVARSMAYE